MDKPMDSGPKGHSWVKTQDGSLTLFSEKFQEACHSTTGAKTETILHYLEGCQVLNKAQSTEGLSVLEVGFGLGLGFLTTYEQMGIVKKKWSFISLELDEELCEWFRMEYAKHPFLKKLSWINDEGFKRLEARDDYCHLIILVGDARKALPHYLDKNKHTWNAIYQDAFSPRKNPTLWTTEWFDLLKCYAAPEAILSTYSASSSIRKSLLGAGWKISKGVAFGPKRASTRASLQGNSDPEILLQLERSPIGALKDDNVAAISKN